MFVSQRKLIEDGWKYEFKKRTVSGDDAEFGLLQMLDSNAARKSGRMKLQWMLGL